MVLHSNGPLLLVLSLISGPVELVIGVRNDEEDTAAPRSSSHIGDASTLEVAKPLTITATAQVVQGTPSEDGTTQTAQGTPSQDFIVPSNATREDPSGARINTRTDYSVRAEIRIGMDEPIPIDNPFVHKGKLALNINNYHCSCSPPEGNRTYSAITQNDITSRCSTSLCKFCECCAWCMDHLPWQGGQYGCDIQSIPTLVGKYFGNSLDKAIVVDEEALERDGKEDSAQRASCSDYLHCLSTEASTRPRTVIANQVASVGAC